MPDTSHSDIVPAATGKVLDRIRGLLYGLAVGDSLGNTTEGQTPATRRARYGEIRDYLPNRYVGGRRRGTPTDDTQMAFWTVDHLLRYRTIVPEELAAQFAAHRIFGIGSTVRRFLATYTAHPQDDWHRWGRPSAGNGALMRISPLALTPWLSAEDPTELTIRAGALTHNDPASIGSSVALMTICLELLTGSGRPGDPLWWLNRWIELSRPLEGDTVYTPRGGEFRNWSGSLWQFLDTHVREAFAADTPTVDACNRWYSGAYLLETVPSVLYILMRHGHNPEEAIIRAVNDTKDNDTVAAIVGTAVGAAHGLSRLPDRWISGLSGRITGNDDGAVQRLIDQTVRAIEDGAAAGGGHDH